MRELPALRICLPAEGHQDHAARTGGLQIGERGEDAKGIEIDMLRCIFCGFCQEVCPRKRSSCKRIIRSPARAGRK